jgi:hypothetical protein
MRDEIGDETETRLPVVITPPRAPSLRARPALDSGFISQLIAERDHLPSQSRRRQAPVSTAIAAYHHGERSDARRLPQGFFRTAEA